MTTKRPPRLDYCQYLLASQINCTITNYADQTGNAMSHDAINRYLRDDRLTPRLVWENVRGQIQASPQGDIVFDDTVLDKNFSYKIDMVRRQYSGNAHGLIKGVGLVNCVYVNPESGQYWGIDYRVYDPDHDGKTKRDHVQGMLQQVVHHKQRAFHAVLMDIWYATKDRMLFIDALGWPHHEGAHGKIIKSKGFPNTYKVKLVRVAVSTHRTNWVVTTDLTQDSLDATQEVWGMRWKIEQFHREIKQLTDIEQNQCRKERIQRNHIPCARLVWIRLTDLARKTKQTVYRIKHGLLDDYLCQQLKNPVVTMRFA